MIRILFSLLCALTTAAACAPLQANAPTYDITSTNNAVTYSWKDETAYFDITDATGIGNAQIKRTSGSMPEKVIFRVHLKGLENFALRWNNDQSRVSVHSGDGSILQEAGASDGIISTIDSNASQWMPIEIVATDKTIALKDGYFQLTAPPAFLISNAQSFDLDWIDFYR